MPDGPLRITGVFADPAAPALRFEFNRTPTEQEIAQFKALPPSIKVATDLGDMIRRAMTMEIVARLCRVYVLAGVAFPEGPAATKWLRQYIDANDPACAHGPLGEPIAWPDHLPGTARMLRDWGFERSPNGWIARTGTHAKPPGLVPS